MTCRRFQPLHSGAATARQAAVFATTVPTTTTTQHLRQQFAPYRATPLLRGMDQLEDMPASTTRVPRNPHRGPNKRQVNLTERAQWNFMKRWELIMRGEWDPLERFRHLPKPKKQFGNEAAEIIWPYSVLLENVIKVHPFTKSLYVYYGQHQLTSEGRRDTSLAKRVAHECLIPISFHNSAVYTETEMLLEHSDTPWVVINCLDGRSKVFAVAYDDPTADEDAAKDAFLRKILSVCEELGKSVQRPKDMFRLLNERPNQNQYIRVDYQWMGDTPEERRQHTVQWVTDPLLAEPKFHKRHGRVLDKLNYDGKLPIDASLVNNVRRENQRMRRPSFFSAAKSFARPNRQLATHSRFGANK